MGGLIDGRGGGMDRLLGRDAEVAAIQAVLDAGLAESGGCLAVRGEPGAGKTALLDVAAGRASLAGMTVLRITGIPSEGHLAFAGLQQLLQFLRDGVRQLPKAGQTSLRAAFEIDENGPPAFFGIALATLELLANAAAVAPLLLVVDDAQWLDRPTQDLLTFVARRVRSDPIVILLGVRDGEEDAFDAARLPELRLGPLDDDAAAALLDAHSPGLSQALRRRLLAAAEGNPLALVELPKSTGQDLDAPAGPPGRRRLTARLERAFAARLPELSDAARAVLLAASANDSADLSEALRAATILTGEVVTVEAVDSASDARLVHVAGAQLRFRHPLVGSAVYQSGSTAERLAAHAALATVLADQPDRRAWHRAAAAIGPDDEAAADLDAVAGRARRRGAVVIAVDALRRAAALTVDARKRADRLLRAAELAAELGQVGSAVQLAQRAGAFAFGEAERCRVLLIEEMTEPGTFEDDARIELLAEAGDQARQVGERDLAMSLLWQAASRCWWGGAAPGTRRTVADAAVRMGLADDDPRLLAVFAYVAQEDRGRATIDRLRRATVDRHDIAALRRVAGGAMVLGEFPLAAARFTEAATELRRQGRLGLLARTLVSGCWPQVYLGRWDSVQTSTEEGARLAAETGQDMWVMGDAGNRAILAAMRGEHDLAEATAIAHQEVALRAGVRVQYALAQQIRGIAALTAGRHGEAYDLLRLMFLPGEQAFHYGVRCWAVGDLAEAAAHTGQRAEARALVAGLEPLAARLPSPFFQLGMRYARALLADDEAEVQFGRALAADLGEWQVDHARLLLAYGSWLRRHRRNAESREPLRRAIGIFDRLGAVPWGQRAREELRATGEVRGSRTVWARERLSPQELRIAELAAEGLTNREIGRHLYLSHRTVGAHLYRVFPKLGVASRSQLSEALSALDADERRCG